MGQKTQGPKNYNKNLLSESLVNNQHVHGTWDVQPEALNPWTTHLIWPSWLLEGWWLPHSHPNAWWFRLVVWGHKLSLLSIGDFSSWTQSTGPQPTIRHEERRLFDLLIHVSCTFLFSPILRSWKCHQFFLKMSAGHGCGIFQSSKKVGLCVASMVALGCVSFIVGGWVSWI